MSVLCLSRRLSRTTPSVLCLASPPGRQNSSKSRPAPARRRASQREARLAPDLPPLLESDRPYGTRKYDPRDYIPKDEDVPEIHNEYFQERIHSNWDAQQYWDDRDVIELFKDPTYFTTPVLMLHCQYADFAVSFHAPDKLNEEDCLWSCFTYDLKIYGSTQRTHLTAIKLIMARAQAMLKKHEVKKLRIVTKGYGCVRDALMEMEENFDGIEFLSITDQSRKLGEESIVYQRAVPRYPSKLSQRSIVEEWPEHDPQTLVEKFRRLNVFLATKPPTVEKGESGPEMLVIKDNEDKASKRGFLTRRSKSIDAAKVGRLKPLEFDPSKI